MKSLAILLFSAALLGLTAFVATPGDKGEVSLTCKVNACEKVDSIYLFEFNGVNFKKIKSAKTADWQTYQFKVPATNPRFYYVGLDPNKLKPVILGTEENVTLNGSCQSFEGALLPNSDLNQQYESVKNSLNQHKNELNTLLRDNQVAEQTGDAAQMNAAALKMLALDKKRLRLVDSLKQVSPYFAKLAALNTYLSYMHHGSADETEMQYFAKNYFKYVDWKDADYNNMPWVYEAVKNFALTLAGVKLPDAEVKAAIDGQLNLIPTESRTYMLALGGVIAGLSQKNNPNLGIYINQYITKYKKTQPEATAQLEKQMQMAGSFIIGAEAPDFAMNTTEGKPMSLKSLRGKVLLVDFWASWCGPCRRENPHVVEYYHKYHSKGFDVLGVSLDSDKQRWLDAIAKDGLIWHHVSDLKGWQNEAAKLYGVSSIPHTVLLDRDGKIIARNLRGPQLDAKLREIFGE